MSSSRFRCADARRGFECFKPCRNIASSWARCDDAIPFMDGGAHVRLSGVFL